MSRVTAAQGEAVEFTGGPSTLQRIVVTTPGGTTRLLKVSCGPAPRAWHRELKELASTPTHNPQPAADTLWVFKDGSGQPATPTLHTMDSQTGLRPTAETAFEFSHDQRWVELRVVVGQGGATLEAGASRRGALGPTIPWPQTDFPAGVHLLKFRDPAHPADLENRLARVYLKLLFGEAIVTHVSTPFYEE